MSCVAWPVPAHLHAPASHAGLPLPVPPALPLRPALLPAPARALPPAPPPPRAPLPSVPAPLPSGGVQAGLEPSRTGSATADRFTVKGLVDIGVDEVTAAFTDRLPEALGAGTASR